MADFIYQDGLHFVRAVIVGMQLSLLYDFIRIFRRIVRHKRSWSIAVQDIIFWFVAGFRLFTFALEVRDGILRGFLLIGAILGAIAYNRIIGRRLIKYVSLIIRMIKKGVRSFGKKKTIQ